VPSRPDITLAKARSLQELLASKERYENACGHNLGYLLLRWIAAMTAVETYSIWERYAERRLLYSLSHYPEHFLRSNTVVGVRAIPRGLAAVLIRGNRYFDFRSTGDLIAQGDTFLGRTKNPFRNLTPRAQEYMDTLGAIRNCIVHQSKRSQVAYRRHLTNVYGLKEATHARRISSRDRLSSK